MNASDNLDLDKLRAELVRELGLMAYKFLITLNGGAIIVLLTFVGNISGSAMFSVSLASAQWSIVLFVASISLTSISMTIAYLSAQMSLLDASLPGGNSAFGHIISLVVPVVLSFLAFVAGVLVAVYGLS